MLMNLTFESFFDPDHLIEVKVWNLKTVRPLFWNSSKPDQKWERANARRSDKNRCQLRWYHSSTDSCISSEENIHPAPTINTPHPPKTISCPIKIYIPDGTGRMDIE